MVSAKLRPKFKIAWEYVEVVARSCRNLKIIFCFSICLSSLAIPPEKPQRLVLPAEAEQFLVAPFGDAARQVLATLPIDRTSGNLEALLWKLEFEREALRELTTKFEELALFEAEFADFKSNHPQLFNFPESDTVMARLRELARRASSLQPRERSELSDLEKRIGMSVFTTDFQSLEGVLSTIETLRAQVNSGPVITLLEAGDDLRTLEREEMLIRRQAWEAVRQRERARLLKVLSELESLSPWVRRKTLIRDLESLVAEFKAGKNKNEISRIYERVILLSYREPRRLDLVLEFIMRFTSRQIGAVATAQIALLTLEGEEAALTAIYLEGCGEKISALAADHQYYRPAPIELFGSIYRP